MIPPLPYDRLDCTRLKKPATCGRCGKPVTRCKGFLVDELGSYCARCEFTHAARKHLGDKGRWTEMRDLFVRQGGRCAYSGEVLVLGFTTGQVGPANATVDHRQPRSRGGLDEIDNLLWVTAAVNVAKGCFTHAEFVALCRKVAECSVQLPAS